MAIYRSDKRAVVYCPLIPGKPDLCGVSHKRVVQKGQKGPTCWQYALNMLRLRVGKNFPIHMMELRRIEIICSQRRKAITKAWEMNLNSEEKLLEQMIKIDTAFLAQFQISPERHFLKKKCLFSSIWKGEWSDQCKIDKRAFLNNLCFEVAAQKFGFRAARWHPESDIKDLAAELDRKGHMIVVGLFGKNYYAEKPYSKKDPHIERIVYGWKSEKNRLALGRHSIVIVGANRKTGTVYYVDPLDESDPSKDQDEPGQRNIYRMPYAELCNEAINLFFTELSPTTFCIYGLFAPSKMLHSHL